MMRFVGLMLVLFIVLSGCNQEKPQEIKKETAQIEEKEKEIEIEHKYFDDEFVKLLEQGYVKGIPVQIGTTIGEIKSKYGEPMSIGEGEGSYYLEYEKVNFHYQATPEVTDSEEIIVIQFYLDDTKFEDLQTGLGMPNGMGTSEMDGDFFMMYDFTKYELWAKSDSQENYIQYIYLKKK